MLGLILSLLGNKFLFEYTREQQQLSIERNAESHSEQLQVSITTAINTLSSIPAFFQVHENISQDRFSRFVEYDAAIKTGILALAWVPLITHEHREQFEVEQNKFLRGYRSITEVNGHGLIVPAQIRDEYFPIQNLFTNRDTELFIGLNLTAKLSMRKNIDQAIISEKLFATQAKNSAPATSERKIFQAYFPVYDLDDKLELEKNNQKKLMGFAMGVFDIDILVKNTKSVNLLLFDVDSKKKNQLISKSKTEYLDSLNLKNIHDLSKLTLPYWTHYFDVGNRTWLGVFLADDMNEGENKKWLP